jgi:carboxyl-terminal processing protease
MKYSWLAAGIILSFNANAQEICTRAQHLVDKLNTLHIQPRPVDDSLSADIFSEFFETLDPEKQFFISKDTGSLVPYRYKLDDGSDHVCSFIDASIGLYRKKAEWYRNFVDSLLANPVDLSKTEFGPAVVASDQAMSNTMAELKDRILKEIKVKILLGIYRHATIDSTILIDADAFGKAEPQARQRIRKNELVKLEKILKDEYALIAELHNSYLKAIPAVFDPHSAYFSKEEMGAFSESLNPSALSFGIKLEESAIGEVSVGKVVPGSPAWNSNQVHKGDVLIGIRWRSSGEYVDLVDLDEEVIQSILEQPGEISADITIRKTTGEIRDVKLVKENLENEENIVSGFVLKGKASKRSIGYISLPGFFTDINPEARGCAVAVTKEIIKLKGESIEGLILDLRFNGGGSLFEAIELSGLFIDSGPVGVVETRGEAPVSIKDANRGTVYDGPLVVMVNGVSASASEVVSSALQDYHRAIIVGSTTFGKATGQTVVALNDADPSQGFLKVTEMKLYRVTGQSNQKKGVTPDFAIPDVSSVIYQREEQNRFALKPGTTNKKTYYTPLTKRLGETFNYKIDDSSFEVVRDMEKAFTARIPLERHAFIAFMRHIETVSRKARQGSGSSAYSVSNSRFDASVLKLDVYHTEMNKEIISQVSSSIYIQEAYRLLDSVIAQKK